MNPQLLSQLVALRRIRARAGASDRRIPAVKWPGAVVIVHRKWLACRKREAVQDHREDVQKLVAWLRWSGGKGEWM
jgi:hypothetical protein